MGFWHVRKVARREPSGLTARTLAVGLLIGCLIGASNVGIGLKIGITFGASIVSVVIAVAVFRALGGLLRTPYTPREALMASTSGSAASFMASAAGLTSAIPALGMLGVRLGYWQLVTWSLAVASLGVLFVIPLRRVMVVRERLRFPSGTASAETIQAMFAPDDQSAGKRARLLAIAALGAAVLSVLFSLEPLGLGRYQNLGLDDIGLTGIGIAGISWAALKMGLSLSPMVWGAGILVGPRVGWSLLGGSLLAWGLGGPMLVDAGLVDPAGTSMFKAVFQWLMWPGVSIMIFAGLTGLALRYRTLLRTFTSLRIRAADPAGEEDAPDPFPFKPWLAGLVASVSATVLLCWFLFDITPWMALLAVLVSFVFCAIAVRAVGETDINPSGPMAKITQLIYGALDPGLVTTNVMTAGITAAGASQGADMMSDLKAGFILKASVRRQVLAQLAGVAVAGFALSGVYLALTSAYQVPGERFGAPAARSWYAMARVLRDGLAGMPPGAAWAALGAGVAGVVLAVLGRLKKVSRWLPSPVALGIACLVAPYYALALWLASLAAWLATRRRGPAAGQMGASVASGLIAGEGILMVVVAVLLLFGVEWVGG